ncbi:MAG: helix-turn-helix domain-containing protein [Natronomonas sp.]|jgi:DNA-binding transcriptional ArsR family regulator|uniref:ArsR/SmtB family transcription factor n=1 Tax=Natronomonas sp. TaxID=2184060 RepID=UPI00286FF11E|nr:helix-turn-helix domain-containing protein [Natronomonas sp.]MDR9380549.1 helix-turn-helix domain-containing protein [Natronomonas sp.]MDR9430738.1 helix-turn-helix domain-containing protein [Natronomonas sp.]
MSLLPSSPDISPDGEPRVVGLDSEEADELMAALSSQTARRILAALHDEPAPPGELADRVDTSLQNAQYHLAKLEDAGAIEIVGTAYSEKGREMSIYGPADSPLVIFAGEKERASGLRAAVSRLFAGFLALGVGGAVVQSLFGEGLVGGPSAPGGASTDRAEPTPEPSATPGDGDVGAFGAAERTPEPTSAPEPTVTPTSEATDVATETADGLAVLFGGGMPPGLAFFLGGAIVLTIVVGVTYLRSRPR